MREEGKGKKRQRKEKEKKDEKPSKVPFRLEGKKWEMRSEGRKDVEGRWEREKET